MVGANQCVHPALIKQFKKTTNAVKDYIRKLENDREYYQLRARQIEGSEATDTKIAIMLDNDIPLPKRSLIRFTMDEHRGIYISTTLAGPLFVQGDDAIEVHPSASNSIYIKLVNRG